MACGVPALAFAAGGLPEVIRGGIDGVLVPPHDDAAMAKAAIALLTDPARLAATGAAAREAAVSRFAKERIVPQYERIYERVLAGGARE
jgi:glycosyltransferase involved in cell wall biosynthesis